MDPDLLLAAAESYVTPIAVIDDAVMQRNIDRMADTARRASARLRPHAKTHKSARVAKRQLQAGAIGLTVATLREAEYFAEHEIDDLLLVHPPADEPKLRRLQALAQRVPRLAVAADNLEVALRLPDAVEVLWEVDTGGRRVGTQPGTPTVVSVQELVAEIGQKRYRGLLTHAGHSYGASGEADRRRIAQEEVGLLVETASLLQDSGIEVREISVGSTPTATFAPEIGGMTELRPGTYVYGDANQVALGSHALEDCALSVIATVVSTPEPNRLILDAGSKALAADSRAPGVPGYGIVLGRPDWTIMKLNEEHATVTSESPSGAHIGDRVVIVPCHVCTTVNLHGQWLVASPDGRPVWDQTDARGWQPAAS